MREINDYGLKMCKYQGDLFRSSIDMVRCSSPIFLRRFMYSEVAVRMDSDGFLFESTDITDIINEIEGQFGESDYGKMKYSENELYWMGYLYRYWAYTKECSSKSIYKIVKPAELRELYFSYHSLDPSQAIERILEAKGIAFEKDMIKKGVEILRRIRNG
ncbi:MAG: antitoxin [Lachnospiraceae bacterium]|nr:antitoxin [Lachnospiraceae bacterium]